MTDMQWKSFVEYRNGLREYCESKRNLYEELKELQKAARVKENGDYPLENPLVYNTAYDDVTRDDETNLIVIGDNPGKDEQLDANRKYLVGLSGKIACGFFQKNPELGVDFRKSTIIMNKTPVHTAKTNQIKYLLKNGSSDVVDLIEESQVKMAKMAHELHSKLIEGCAAGKQKCQLWLVGYAELKPRGIFQKYRDELVSCYSESDWEYVRVFQHFSMNRFTVDLSAYREKNPGLTLGESLAGLGEAHRKEIFGR